MANSPHQEAVIRDDEKAGADHVPEIVQAIQEDVDPAVSNRVIRKIDLHILPWLFGMWFFCFLDRASIGNAKIEGLIEDLRLKKNQFNIALTVFFITYILVDIPSNWLVKKVKPGRYLPALTVGWGLVTICLGFVKNFGALCALRFLLGIFEGGLAGGIVLYLTIFYPREQMVLRIALFYSAAPFSGAFGGLLAGGLSQIRVGSYQKWPWIFFIEGAMTLLFGLLSLAFLPHSPQESKFLDDGEKIIALQHLAKHNPTPGIPVSAYEDKFHWHWVKIGLLDANTWFCSLTWLAIIVPIYSFAFFLPSIIRQLGYSSLISQILTVPPNMCGFLMVLIVATASDRFKMRGIFILSGCLLAIIGYIILLLGHSPSVKYGGTFFIAAGIFPCTPLLLGWLANQIAPFYARASAGGLQVSVGNLAAFPATFSYLEQYAPEYKIGHYINLGALVVGLLLVLGNLVYIRWENGKRARGERDYRIQRDGEEWLGHRHPAYRYIS